jgi:PAS domain S-box-containing protein
MKDFGSARHRQALFDNFPFLVWLKDTDSRFLAVNQKVVERLGQTSVDALLGKTDFDFLPAALAERYLADDQEVMRTRQQKTLEECVRRQGRSYWSETYKAPVLDADGGLLGTVGFSRDISDRKAAEEAMLLRNAALAGLLRGEPLAATLELLIMSVHAELPDWSLAILAVDDRSQQLRFAAAPNLPDDYRRAVDGMAIAETGGPCAVAAARRQRLVIPDLLADPAWANFHAPARETGVAACWIEPIIDHQDRLLAVMAAFNAKPAVPDAGQSALLMQAAQVVSLMLIHQRGAEETQNSQTTFRGIFDSINEAIFIQARDGTFLDANAAAEKLFAASRHELIGHTHLRLSATDLNDPQQVIRAIEMAFADQPQTFEFWGRKDSGVIFPVEVRLNVTAYFGQPAVIAVVTDMTERRLADLRKSVEHDLARGWVRGSVVTEYSIASSMPPCVFRILIALPFIISGRMVATGLPPVADCRRRCLPGLANTRLIRLWRCWRVPGGCTGAVTVTRRASWPRPSLRRPCRQKACAAWRCCRCRWMASRWFA